MKRLLTILGLGTAALVTMAFIGLVYIGIVGPETFVVSGKQVTKRHLQEIRALGLLDADEAIRYFYSDGLLDIREGLYLVTAKKLVVYSSEWENPAVIIPFGEIVALAIEYNDDWLEDSYVSVTLTDGSEVLFPLSSERGGDKKFYEYLQSRRGESPR